MKIKIISFFNILRSIGNMQLAKPAGSRTFRISTPLLIAYCLLLIVGLGSCKKYLDVVPKGQKIPTTLADFEALVRDEYQNHRGPVTQTILLLNDRFETQATINGNPLWKANYMWDETANRINLNISDESAYYTAYGA